VGLGLALGSSAQADPKNDPAKNGPSLDCPSSSEEGQRLRDKNRYAEARTMFRACALKTCPGVVRKDCSKWLAELEEAQPSVVFAVQDATGADLSDVTVQVDGKGVATRLDGSPIQVDPGEHDLRVEAAGHTALTQRLIVRVNEKNRLVRLAFKDGPQPAAPIGPPTPVAPATPPPPPAERGFPVAAAIAGGVSLLGFGSFGYFGLTSKSDLDGLRSGCAPYCEPASLDDVKSRMLVADISLGVGVVALGVATVLLITHFSDPRPVVQVGQPQLPTLQKPLTVSRSDVRTSVE